MPIRNGATTIGNRISVVASPFPGKSRWKSQGDCNSEDHLDQGADDGKPQAPEQSLPKLGIAEELDIVLEADKRRIVDIVDTGIKQAQTKPVQDRIKRKRHQPDCQRQEQEKTDESFLFHWIRETSGFTKIKRTELMLRPFVDSNGSYCQ